MSSLPLPAGSIAAVQRAIEYAEGHLSDALSVADMAAAAGYSLFHFVRVFNAAVHHTPYDYLVRRRLSVAAGRLTSSDTRIIDLALEAGFGSPEAFARAFRRMFGAGPGEYRQAGGVNATRRLAPRTLEHLQLLTHPDFRPPQRLERPAVRLAGLMAACDAGAESAAVSPDRPALWADLNYVLAAAGLGSQAADCYGVSLYLPGTLPRRYYLAARPLAALPPPLVALELPAGSYAAFTHPGSLERLDLTRAYIYQTWLPLSGLQPALPLEIEVYPAGWPQEHPPAGLKLWIPISQEPAPASGVEIPQNSSGKP